MNQEIVSKFEPICLCRKLDVELVLEIERISWMEYPEEFVMIFPDLFELDIDKIGFPKLVLKTHPDVKTYNNYLTDTIIVMKLRQAES